MVLDISCAAWYAIFVGCKRRLHLVRRDPAAVD
nr:MAG TPA: hypothetical protein [Caudoviricetes sp.]